MHHDDASPTLPPPHSRIGRVHVRHLRAMTSSLRAVDHRHGGGSCRTPVQALLPWCDKGFAHPASAAVRHDLRCAIAELHALAGWTAFDAGLGGSAQRGRSAVDGDRFSGQSLAAFLHAEGYEVALVATIPAAEGSLQSPPALAIVDLLTSDGEGARFAAAARTFGVPVVAVSAIEPAAHVADAYPPKPAHPLRVLAAVRDLLSPDS